MFAAAWLPLVSSLLASFQSADLSLVSTARTTSGAEYLNNNFEFNKYQKFNQCLFTHMTNMQFFLAWFILLADAAELTIGIFLERIFQKQILAIMY